MSLYLPIPGIISPPTVHDSSPDVELHRFAERSTHTFVGKAIHTYIQRNKRTYTHTLPKLVYGPRQEVGSGIYSLFACVHFGVHICSEFQELIQDAYSYIDILNYESGRRRCGTKLMSCLSGPTTTEEDAMPVSGVLTRTRTVLDAKLRF